MKAGAVLVFFLGMMEFILGCALLWPTRGADLILTWPVTALLWWIAWDLWKDA